MALSEMQSHFATQQKWIDQQSQTSNLAMADLRGEVGKLSRSTAENTTALRDIQQQFTALTRSVNQMCNNLDLIAKVMQSLMDASAMQ